MVASTSTPGPYIRKRPSWLKSVVRVVQCIPILVTCAVLALLMFHRAEIYKLGEVSDAGITFTDTSIAAGLKRPYGKRKKYGGAAVADLDGDSHLDLLLCHHDDKYMQVYFGVGDGTFKLNPWNIWTDAHAMSPVRLGPWQDRLHFLVNQGGSFGIRPKSQMMFRVTPNRTIIDVSEQVGIAGPSSPVHGKGRGRSAIFLNLRHPGVRNAPFLDAILTNGKPRPNAIGGGIQTWGYQGISRARLVPRNLTGDITKDLNEYYTVTDVEGDGRMEVVTFFELRMYAVKQLAFDLKDISAKVLPKLDYRGTIAVCEFDFDNDGLFDLYLARTNSGDLFWVKNTDNQDRLLKNMGGYYEDISSRAGIPRGGQSRGVTAGDFDNDGFMDLIVTRWDEPDLLLRNLDGLKFEIQDAGLNRAKDVPGDMPTAADFDRDGRVDLIVSEGDWFDQKMGGFYRILKNTRPTIGNYLHVRVLSSPTGNSTSMHAVVRVSLGNGNMNLIRRVGSPGTSVSNSYIETVHFGLGSYTTPDSVSVHWTDGYIQTLRNIPTRSLLTLGRNSTFNSAPE